MNYFIYKLISIFLVVIQVCAEADEDRPQKFAVLLATTKSWIYYRHQSTVLHAYHTLIANGVPKENIITMIYGDIANHPKNPEPGVIRNHPFGPNLHVQNLTNAYVGKTVNAENFLAVLSGKRGPNAGPVIKSRSQDSIFIYVCGLGTYRTLTFPTGPSLTADKFMDALKQVRAESRAKNIFVMLDVAYAASLVHGIVPRHDNIFVSTATHFKELPWAVYCFPEKKICYSTLYGAAWTSYSDRLRRLKYGRRETLFDQFNAVRTLSVYSHVNIYGQLEMGRKRLKEFLNYKLERKRKSRDVVSDLVFELSERALSEMENKMEDDDEETNDQYDALYEKFGRNEEEDWELSIAEEGGESFKAMSEADVLPMFMADEDVSALADDLTKRKVIEDTMRSILQALDLDFDSLEEPSAEMTSETVDDYEKSIEFFNSTCINVNENTYVLQFLSKLAKICEMRMPLEKQFEAMRSVCSDKHRQVTFS